MTNQNTAPASTFLSGCALLDGTAVTVSTMKSRVADIVAENGFNVGERDELIPGASRTVGDAETIVLRRSRPLQISLDGREPTEMWTTAATVDEALAQLSMADAAPAAASRGSRLPLQGMALPVVSAKTVQIDDGGVLRTVRLAAPNVGGLLAAAGIPLQQRDTVLPSAAAPVVDGMQIRSQAQVALDSKRVDQPAGACRQACGRTTIGRSFRDDLHLSPVRRPADRGPPGRTNHHRPTGHGRRQRPIDQPHPANHTQCLVDAADVDPNPRPPPRDDVVVVPHGVAWCALSHPERTRTPTPPIQKRSDGARRGQTGPEGARRGDRGTLGDAQERPNSPGDRAPWWSPDGRHHR